MSLTKYKRFENLHYQDGNYINIEDRSVWPVNGKNKDDMVLCAVWYLKDDPSEINLSFYDSPIRFNVDMTKEYELFLYLVVKWKEGAYVPGQIVWDEDSVWECTAPTSTKPHQFERLIPPWTKIIDNNIDRLNGLTEAYSAHYYIKPTTVVGELQAGNIAVTKVDDHKFKVEWLSTGDLTAVDLFDYSSNYIRTLSPADNQVTVELEKDGVYYLSMNINNGTIHYAEIYDFTDAEKCYLNLMRDILCNCLTCEDCPGKNYERALNFANMYQLLKNMVSSDQIIRAGIITTDVLRGEYIEMMGLMIAKLAILTESCLCDKNTKVDT